MIDSSIFAPSIANAGTSLLNDVSAISAKERAAKAKARAGKISYQQQEAANFLQAKAQAFGINQALTTKELTTNFEQRAKRNASEWEAYTKMANTNLSEALKFGMKKWLTLAKKMAYSLLKIKKFKIPQLYHF